MAYLPFYLIYNWQNKIVANSKKFLVLVSMWVVIPLESILRDLKNVMLFPIYGEGIT